MKKDKTTSIQPALPPIDHPDYSRLDIEDLVRRQIALYRASEIRAEQAQRSERGKKGKLAFGPYLLISREKGAGGHAVGQLTAARLGWQLFDGQIVDAIAAKAGVRRELIESLDESDRGMIDDIVCAFLDPQCIDTTSYLAKLREIVLVLGHQGDVVIVGRGAQYILPTPFGLQVRMVAPMEVRIQRVADGKKLTRKAAQAEVEESDRERARMIHRHYRRDLKDPLNYDIVVNTAELTVEAAAEIIVAGVHQKLAVPLKGTA